MTKVEAPTQTIIPQNGKLRPSFNNSKNRAIILSSKSREMLRLVPGFQTNGGINFSEFIEPTPSSLLAIASEAEGVLLEAAANQANNYKIYLSEIARIPLLTAVEEKQLASQYRIGVEAENLLLEQ